MKVKATTPEMVVVDPEETENIHIFDGKHMYLAHVKMVRMYEDRFELDLRMTDQCGRAVIKTFKMHFDDLLQMDATMHQICTSFKGGKKAEKETTNHP